ncbi:hypothetical protein COU61_02675 [Candidatus Pacearchaeota archaeon CG10_big_fil_rev_8_21_14_0_10_35_13]|nr:MAG: hypothetical protein COU61_02675 [Candidatus Pacearchaeota archaeon CG10_big_fil_rev_8_21_14_0_10_35_13]
MEHKDYTLEIVGELLREKGHARAIAKNLKTNHMTINRKIKELLDKNVLDLKEEGRNKSYYLKKTIEAKRYVYMYEHYKLLEFLKKHPDMKRLIKEIQDDKRFRIAMIFGSYAKGLEKKESDIDLYIGTEDSKVKKDLEKLDNRINMKIGKYNKENLLIKEIEKNHIIIKGVEEYYERNKIFD